MPSRFTGGVTEKKRFTKSRTVVSNASILGGMVVGISGAARTAVIGTAALRPYGVALHDASAGKGLTVALDGEIQLIASGAINAGDTVIAAAAGAVSAAGATPDARFVVGTATTTAAGGFVFVEVQL